MMTHGDEVFVDAITRNSKTTAYEVDREGDLVEKEARPPTPLRVQRSRLWKRAFLF